MRLWTYEARQARSGARRSAKCAVLNINDRLRDPVATQSRLSRKSVASLSREILIERRCTPSLRPSVAEAVIGSGVRIDETSTDVARVDAKPRSWTADPRCLARYAYRSTDLTGGKLIRSRGYTGSTTCDRIRPAPRTRAGRSAVRKSLFPVVM